jgi:S1-C subfamily serine protease
MLHRENAEDDPTGGTGFDPSSGAAPSASRVAIRPPTPTHVGRRWLAILIAVIGLALLSGAAGGLVAHQFDAAGRLSAVSATPTLAPSGAPSISSQALDVSAIVAKIQPAIVNVHVSVRLGQVVRNGAGTGIILTSSGEVITNAHVVNNATTITVTLTGLSQSRSARLVGLDAKADIALLQLNDASGLPVASLGTSTAVKVGDDVIAVGYSLDLQGPPSVSRGIVSAIDRSFDTGNGVHTGLIQTDAAISSGNSGGALVNAHGEVIGITTFVAAPSGSATADNLNFAIPIVQAIVIVQQIRGTLAA